MRLPEEALSLAVEATARNVVVIRVAGTLDRLTAPRLLRLLDGQLHRRDASLRVSVSCLAPGPAAEVEEQQHLVVDLAEVRHFGVGGLDAMRHAQFVAGQTGIALHLTGLTARAGLLPGWATALIPEFSTFPVLEHALAALGPSGGPRRAAGQPQHVGADLRRDADPGW